MEWARTPALAEASCTQPSRSSRRPTWPASTGPDGRGRAKPCAASARRRASAGERLSGRRGISPPSRPRPPSSPLLHASRPRHTFPPARAPAAAAPRGDGRTGTHPRAGGCLRGGEWAVAEASVDVLRILIAILLPPLGVFLQVGLGLQFWINILLTLLGYVPGIIHAIYIIVRR